MKRCLFVVNDPAFFLSHRLPLAEAARSTGYEVHVASMPGVAVKRIVAAGFAHHVLPLNRSSKSPLSELRAFVSIYGLFVYLKPALVHLVTIKPVLYGGIAARLAGVPAVVAAISGLGAVFIAKGLRSSLVRLFVKWLYRVALGKSNVAVIFQNPDDRDVLLAARAVSRDKVWLIRGSGVELSDYAYMPEPGGVPLVYFAARMLKDKGVVEFVEAARILKARGVVARFVLIGDVDTGNPATVSTQMLDEWQKEACVEWLGYREDVATLFSAAHLVVLPSYREGLPKVLIEAAACGRAVVTTDVPGCRDAIEPGKTGVLVPVRNVPALANAIEALLADSERRQAMGYSGRMLAEREFAIEKVVAVHMAIYRSLDSRT